MIKFIATIRVDRGHREKELEKEAEARDARRDMECERLKGMTKRETGKRKNRRLQ